MYYTSLTRAVTRQAGVVMRRLIDQYLINRMAHRPVGDMQFIRQWGSGVHRAREI